MLSWDTSDNLRISLWISQTILGYFGLSWAILAHHEQSRAKSGNLWIYLAISGYLWLSITISAYLYDVSNRVQVEAGESRLLLFETFSLVYF